RPIVLKPKPATVRLVSVIDRRDFEGGDGGGYSKWLSPVSRLS
ncbi:hypothetical protein ACN38_g9106, partial [Penicillium nordicum]